MVLRDVYYEIVANYSKRDTEKLKKAIKSDSGGRSSDSTYFSWAIAIGQAMVMIAPSLSAAWEFTNTNVALLILAMPTLLFFRFLVSRQRGFEPNRAVLLLLIATILVTFAALLPAYRQGGYIAEKSINAIGFYSLALYSSTACCLASLTYGKHSSVKVMLNSLYVASVSVCGAQLVLLGLGVENPLAGSAPQVGTEAITLAFLGIDLGRVILPLASGFQAGAIAPLTASIIALTRMRRGAQLREYLFFLVGLLPLLFLDARQFLLAIIVTAILTHRTVPAWVAATGATMMPGIFVAMPLVIREALPILTGVATMRSDKFGMFSGREYIWDQFWRYMRDIDAGPFFFGNGIYGHAISGVSKSYGRLFGGWGSEAQSFMHLHNSYLQIFIDTGLLGLFLWCTMIWLAIYRAMYNSNGQGKDSSGWRAISRILIAFCVVASSEVIFGVYMKESIGIWSILFMSVSIYNRQRDASRQRHDSTGIRARSPATADSV